jgi:hypothetical protein
MKSRLRRRSEGYGSVIPVSFARLLPRPFRAPVLEIRAHRPMGTQF